MFALILSVDIISGERMLLLTVFGEFCLAKQLPAQHGNHSVPDSRLCHMLAVEYNCYQETMQLLAKSYNEMAILKNSPAPVDIATLAYMITYYFVLQ